MPFNLPVKNHRGLLLLGVLLWFIIATEVICVLNPAGKFHHKLPSIFCQVEIICLYQSCVNDYFLLLPPSPRCRLWRLQRKLLMRAWKRFWLQIYEAHLVTQHLENDQDQIGKSVNLGEMQSTVQSSSVNELQEAQKRVKISLIYCICFYVVLFAFFLS